MPSLNKIEIIGNVGSNPELRFTPNGKPVANFSVATNRKYTKSDGEKVEETEWFDVVVWNRLAETCNQFLGKGQLVYVSGRVFLHKWDKPDGSHGSKLEIQGNSVLFLSRPNIEKQTDDLGPEY